MKSVTLALAATGMVALAASASPGFGMTPEKAKAKTADYRLELDIGGEEMMYSKADAKRLKPNGGEIMVSGKMARGMASNDSMPNGKHLYHLELHVRSKQTDQPVRDAKVRISISGVSLKQPVTVPIAVMYGIVAGKNDWHYGNNVQLASGSYVVYVSANGETAKFDIKIPKG